MRNLRGRRRSCWPVETVGVGLVGVVVGPVGRISGGIDRRARGLLGGPGRQAVLAGVELVLESAAAERLVRGVMESRLIDAVLAELLESDGLWVMIEEIAQSPAVTNAISQQGVGFANQMAGVVRDRSRTADDRLERLARRFTRRARSGPPDPLAVDLQVDGAPVVERVVVEEIVLDSMTVDPPGGIGRAPEP